MIDVNLCFSLFCALHVLSDFNGKPVPGVEISTKEGVPPPLRKSDGIFAFLRAYGDAISVTVTAPFYESRVLTLLQGTVTIEQLRATRDFPLPAGAAGISGEGTPGGIAALAPRLATHRLPTTEVTAGERVLPVREIPSPYWLGAALYLHDPKADRGEICSVADIASNGIMLEKPLQNGYGAGWAYRLHTARCDESGAFFMPVPAAEKALYWKDLQSPPQTVALPAGYSQLAKG